MTIEKALEKFKNNTLTVDDIWFDWFCKTESLKLKTKKLMSHVKRLSKYWSKSFLKYQIEFKNCCPLTGNLYDAIIISDDRGFIMYKIIPSKTKSERVSPYNTYKKLIKKSVLLKFVDEKTDLIEINLKNESWKDIVEYFKTQVVK